MEVDENGRPMSRMAHCPGCGRRERVLADEELDCGCGYYDPIRVPCSSCGFEYVSLDRMNDGTFAGECEFCGEEMEE